MTEGMSLVGVQQPQTSGGKLMLKPSLANAHLNPQQIDAQSGFEILSLARPSAVSICTREVMQMSLELFCLSASCTSAPSSICGGHVHEFSAYMCEGVHSVLELRRAGTGA